MIPAVTSRIPTVRTPPAFSAPGAANFACPVAVAPPMDSVRFSARRDSKAEIDSIVQVPKNSAVSPEFVKNVRNLTQTMLETIASKFPELEKAMIESGFKIIACRESNEIPIWRKKDFFSGFGAKKETKRLKRLKQQDPKLYKEVISNHIRQFSHEPEIAPLRQIKPLQLKDEHLKLLLWYQAIESVEEEDSCAAFFPILNAVVLPETWFLEEFPHRNTIVPALERTLWHETLHFIEDNIDFLQAEQPLSESSLFRRAVRKDLQEAQRKGIVPAASCRNSIGGALGYYLPVYGWFSYQQEGVNRCFQESLAEIGSVAAGGKGACNKKLIKALCPESIELVKEQFKKLSGQKAASGGDKACPVWKGLV